MSRSASLPRDESEHVTMEKTPVTSSRGEKGMNTEHNIKHHNPDCSICRHGRHTRRTSIRQNQSPWLPGSHATAWGPNSLVPDSTATSSTRFLASRWSRISRHRSQGITLLWERKQNQGVSQHRGHHRLRIWIHHWFLFSEFTFRIDYLTLEVLHFINNYSRTWDITMRRF